MEKQTNPNGKTNKLKRKKKKRQIGAKKKNPNGKTNKSKRKNKKETDRCLNQHRDILAKKKKKIQTEKQTNPNGKTKKRQIGAYRNDRSSWVSLGRSCDDDQSCGSVIGAVDRSCDDDVDR